MTPRPGEGQPDSAWVTVGFPVPEAELRRFLADTALLFRLHPHLEIESWQSGDDLCRLIARHETSGARVATGVHRREGEPEAGFSLDYDTGLKRRTTFRLVGLPDHCELTVTDYYHPLAGDGDPRRIEVDESLVPWILALRRHLLGRRRWAWLPGWRWWHERFLPGMAPRQRRIVRLIVWISLLEFLVFVVLALGWRLAG